MIQRIQSLSRGQRSLVFATLVIGAILLFIAIAMLLTTSSFNLLGRQEARAVRDDVVASEFVALPDEDAYPAALAIDSAGVVYTGSYVSGVVWAITPDGELSELPATRDQIGSVTGLAVSADNTLYILDRLEALTADGAIVWRIPAGGALEQVITIPETDETSAFDDIVLDSQGNIYLSDRARLTVWRIAAAGGDPVAWWTSPPETGADTYEPTGLAYDPITDSILITDASLHRIYRVPAAAADTQAETETVYDHAGREYAPGFDGLTVSAAGEVYVAGLAQNRVYLLNGPDLLLLVDSFRGGSDVAYDPARQRLYVANWNQFSLASGSEPQLPFAIDVVDLSGFQP